MKDARILLFVATYTFGVYYGTYCSLTRNPFIPVHKVKWS
jgi:hypothetical protein